MLTKSEDPYVALLAYRTTPLGNGYSPSELLMGPRLQSTVPIVSDELKPRQANNELLRQRERDYKQRQKHNYDRRHRATNLEKPEPNDNVYAKDQKIWGKVKQDSNTPRSYIVETERGDVRRNRRHLAKVKTDNDEQSDIEITVQKSADLPKQNDSEHCITRSGRISKSPTRFDL